VSQEGPASAGPTTSEKPFKESFHGA